MTADALRTQLEKLRDDWRSRAGDLRHEREPSARCQGWAVGLDEAADELDAALAALRTERGEEPQTLQAKVEQIVQRAGLRTLTLSTVDIAELRADLAARAPHPERMEPEPQVFVWLIERIQPMQINGQATYWTGEQGKNLPEVETNNPWDACWFARQQDAMRVALMMFGTPLARAGWQVVEHGFTRAPHPERTVMPSDDSMRLRDDNQSTLSIPRAPVDAGAQHPAENTAEERVLDLMDKIDESLGRLGLDPLDPPTEARAPQEPPAVVHLDYGKEAVCQIESEAISATFNPEDVTCLKCLRIAAHSFIELETQEAPAAQPLDWQPIETLIDPDREVLMWTPPERLYIQPILPTMKPEMRISTKRMWNWATCWAPKPAEPRLTWPLPSPPAAHAAPTE